jgi:uncharacterized membrane protein SpoIIM required for sporulation
MDRGSAGVWWRVLCFFLIEFPQVYRAELRFMLASLVLFAGPALAAFIGVQKSDELARRLLSPQLIALIQQWQGGTGADPGLRPVASPFILVNNLEVGLLSFAGGVVFGLGSAYVLAMNGLALGAMAGLCQQYGLSLAFWSFVAPHGAIELSVIVIAGGAGLMLGWALLHPGPRNRAEALSTAAMRAVKLLVGCLPLLVLAGLIEGFLSPSAAPPEVKLAVGLLTGVALHSFLLAGGRTGSPRDGEEILPSSHVLTPDRRV